MLNLVKFGDLEVGVDPCAYVYWLIRFPKRMFSNFSDASRCFDRENLTEHRKI